jgi:hypothetical protein
VGNALWLILALPVWYAGLYGAAFAPDDGFKTWGIAAIVASLMLAGGVVLSIRQWNFRPFAVLLLVVGSFVLVALAGLFRGHVEGNLLLVVLLGSTALQAAMGVTLIYRARGARVAAALMFPFCASFWLFATFVAAMSFQDTWL